TRTMLHVTNSSPDREASSARIHEWLLDGLIHRASVPLYRLVGVLPPNRWEAGAAVPLPAGEAGPSGSGADRMSEQPDPPGLAHHLVQGAGRTAVRVGGARLVAPVGVCDQHPAVPVDRDV